MAKTTDGQGKKISRRTVLTAASAGVVAGGVAWATKRYGTQIFLLRQAPTADHYETQWAASRVRSYRPLGRTGFAMSDISFGCAALGNPDVARSAVERGINYFDTSPDYSKAGSETALGAGVRGSAREKLFLASKLCTPEGHLASNTPVPQIIAAVESSLRRLGTDYLDLVHIHACNSIERLMAPNMHEAFDRLRSAGKVRFLGVSSHTPNLEKVMRHAVDSGRFHVIMVAYSFKSWPALTDILRSAHERGVGVVAMKTLKGALQNKLAEFTPTERESFSQAAFKWVLSNPNVSGLVISIDKHAQLDEYLYASGQSVTSEDNALLEKYDRLITRQYCRPGCGACLESCPYGVPIDDIMRYAMYAENYGHKKEAMRLYAEIDSKRRADHCIDCTAPCQQACTYRLPIREKLAKADNLLQLV